MAIEFPVGAHLWPAVPLALLSIAIAIASVLTYTYVTSTIRFHSAIARLEHGTPSSVSEEPPRLPYAIPFLGSTLNFLDFTPGRFFKNVLMRLPKDLGAFKLLLGGQEVYILRTQADVQGLMKAKGASRDHFNDQVMGKGFDASKKDIALLFAKEDHRQGTINQELLLTKNGVDHLTDKFIAVFKDTVRDWKRQQNESGSEVHLNVFLREVMFTASTTSFLGSRILDEYPELCSDFFDFDTDFMALFFGVPKLFKPRPYRLRERLLPKITSWLEEGWNVMDKNEIPDECWWEPVFGSRFFRTRERLFKDQGMTIKGRASTHLASLFGLSSNAIPTASWLLLQIVSPSANRDPSSSLLSRTLAEIQSCVLPSGELDIELLTSAPLLQSMFQEVLRLYTDGLVTRQVAYDLPIAQRMVVQKGSFVIAPTMISHRDEKFWEEYARSRGADDAPPPPEQFYAERFLSLDQETGKTVFSMTGTAGRLYPFGGGSTMCPGRVFAKQEVLAAVAIMLLDFDFLNLTWVDGKGRPMDHFPEPQRNYPGQGIMNMSGDLKCTLSWT